MKLTSRLPLIALLPLLSAGGAMAQSAAWLDFGGTIKGSSTDPDHKNWIEISGFEIGGQLAAGQAGGFSIRKPLDRASNPMFLACATGDLFPKTTLDLSRTSTTKETRLARLELEDVMISSYQISAASGGDQPEESVDLAFKKITYTYFLPDSGTTYTDFDYASLKGSSNGTPVTNPDSDSDGMLDAWETSYGLSIGSNDSAGDLDGDGLTNLQEFQLGTHPKSGTSFFKATLSPAPSTPGTYQLSWNSVAGKTYVIEWSPDLATPFTTLRTVTATAASTTENIVNSGNVGFYRVRPQ